MTRMVMDVPNDRYTADRAGKLRRKLVQLIGERDADRLMSGQEMNPDVDAATGKKLLKLMPEVAAHVRGRA